MLASIHHKRAKYASLSTGLAKMCSHQLWMRVIQPHKHCITCPKANLMQGGVTVEYFMIIRSHFGLILPWQHTTTSPWLSFIPANEDGLSPINAATVHEGENPYLSTKYGEMEPTAVLEGIGFIPNFCSEFHSSCSSNQFGIPLFCSDVHQIHPRTLI